MKTSRKQWYGKVEEVFISSKKVKLKRQLVENNRTRNLDLKNLTLVQKVKKSKKVELWNFWEYSNEWFKFSLMERWSFFCEKLPQKSSVVDTRPNSEVAAKRCSIIKVFSEISRNSSEFYIRLWHHMSQHITFILRFFMKSHI